MLPLFVPHSPPHKLFYSRNIDLYCTVSCNRVVHIEAWGRWCRWSGATGTNSAGGVDGGRLLDKQLLWSWTPRRLQLELVWIGSRNNAYHGGSSSLANVAAYALANGRNGAFLPLLTAIYRLGALGWYLVSWALPKLLWWQGVMGVTPTELLRRVVDQCRYWIQW
jgi:hypothetical protein